MPSTTRVLVLGAAGQVGTDLVYALIKRGYEVIATDIQPPEKVNLPTAYQRLDATHTKALESLIRKERIDTVYHLVAMLSATAEKHPYRGWELNMNTLLDVLELARHIGFRVFWPSSIAVFGPTTPKENVPQHTITAPTTVYGISKVAGELWCQYYYQRYGVDVRSVRFPGLIGWRAMPGGGTTDYAVEIFYHAIQHRKYTSFLAAETVLPMMYMPDAIRAVIELMEAPHETIAIRTSYNISGIAFSPKQLAETIQQYIPEFQIDYAPDHRQQIAESWPRTIDDSAARTHWGWHPAYSLDEMTREMLQHIARKLATVTP